MARLRRTSMDLVSQLQEMVDDLYGLSTATETDVRAERLVAGTIEAGTFIITGSFVSDPAVAQAANWSQYLYFDGTNNTRIETPDAVANSFGGDADIAVLIAPDDWTPASTQCWANKWLTTGDQRSWMFQLLTDGKLLFQWTTNGLDATSVTATSTAATGFADGAKKWIRVTIDINDGGGNRVIKFYTAPTTSSDPDSYDDRPGSWTQLGTTITAAGTTSIYDSTCDLQIGGWNEGQGYRPTGKAYGILIDKGYNTATLWTDANVRLLIGETNPSTAVGYTGWPIDQSSGLDDSPTPVTWTISNGQPGMTLENLLVPEIGFSIDGQTGRESFNTLVSFNSYSESLIAVTASYASVITKTIKLPFTTEIVLIKVYFVAYTTDLGENETIFLQPKVTIGSKVHTGPEISDSNPNATGGVGSLDTTGTNYVSTSISSYAGSAHGQYHSVTGAPSVTLADKKSNLTSVPFVPGGGPVYVSGDEFTVELQTKGTNYTGKPRFGMLVEVFRAQS